MLKIYLKIMFNFLVRQSNRADFPISGIMYGNWENLLEQILLLSMVYFFIKSGGFRDGA